MAASSLLLIILPAALVVLLLVVAAAARSGSHQGGEEMIRKVYVYLVLFATLMMVIGGSVAAFSAVADLIAPVPYQQTYPEFKEYGGKEAGMNPEGPVISEAERQARYQAAVQAEQERQASRAKNNLIKSLGWVIIPLPVFIFFQKRLNDQAGS